MYSKTTKAYTLRIVQFVVLSYSSLYSSIQQVCLPDRTKTLFCPQLSHIYFVECLGQNMFFAFYSKTIQYFFHILYHTLSFVLLPKWTESKYIHCSFLFCFFVVLYEVENVSVGKAPNLACIIYWGLEKGNLK